MICLKISIFVVSNTTLSWLRRMSAELWFAWKFLSLWYQTQLSTIYNITATGCDLLENFYLCGIKHNQTIHHIPLSSVVICLKISIFVVSNTTWLIINTYINWLWFAWKFLSLWYQTQLYHFCKLANISCDLLENFYLCGIKHNCLLQVRIIMVVVICLKISIFVVSNTTFGH